MKLTIFCRLCRAGRCCFHPRRARECLRAHPQTRRYTMSRLLSVIALAVGALTAPTAGLAQPTEHPGGACQAFGANVAGLAGTLGPAFGAAASGVATSGPGNFVTFVVAPEQAQFCS